MAKFGFGFKKAIPKTVAGLTKDEIEAAIRTSNRRKFEALDAAFASTRPGGDTAGTTPARMGKYDTSKFDLRPEPAPYDPETPLYHGTRNGPFDEFDLSRAGENGGAPGAINFAHDEEFARRWAGLHRQDYGIEPPPGAHVIKAFANLKNPKIIQGDGSPRFDPLPESEIEAARAAGHDGVVFRNFDDGGEGVGDFTVVLDPSVIRRGDKPLAQALLGAGAGGAGYAAMNAPGEAEAKPWSPKLSALSKAGEAGWKGEALPSAILAGKPPINEKLAMAEAGIVAASPFAAFMGSELMNDPTLQGNFAMDRAESEWEDYERGRLKELTDRLRAPPPKENIPLPDSYFNTSGMGRPESYGASPLTGKDLFDPSDAPQGGPLTTFEPFSFTPQEARADQQFLADNWKPSAEQRFDAMTPSEQFGSWQGPLMQSLAAMAQLNPTAERQYTNDDLATVLAGVNEAETNFPLWAQDRRHQPLNLLGDTAEMVDPTWVGVGFARDYLDRKKRLRAKKGIM